MEKLPGEASAEEGMGGKSGGLVLFCGALGWIRAVIWCKVPQSLKSFPSDSSIRPRLPVLHLQSPGEGPLLHQGPGAEGAHISGAALSEEGLFPHVPEVVSFPARRELGKFRHCTSRK